MIIGCMLVLSCGQNLSKQELKDLETRAEKGDVKAAITLRDYYNDLIQFSPVEMKELKEKAAQGDKDAQEKIADYNKWEKMVRIVAENGDSESAFLIAVDCYGAFTNGVNVKENKSDYRKFIEIAIAGGYKEKESVDGGISHIDEYKKYYQNQSEEWWNSDSIKTKEQLSDD